MITKLPDWISKRVEFLLKSFGPNEFTREDALSVLGKNFADNENRLDQAFYEMKRLDLLEIIETQEDKRKKIYKLKLANFGNNTKMTKDKLLSLLKKAADIIRTRVDYKFILVLLFLKRTSDKWEEDYQKAKTDLISQGYSKEIAEKEAKFKDYHQFDYDSDLLWENIRKDITKLPENLSKALKTLADKNPELRHVVASADFLQFTSNPENLELLRQLIELFSAEKLDNTSSDILGDAYEWLLYYFAPDKAKEGEVYTPREVIKLLFEMLDPKSIGKRVSIYDPTSGSGGMLIVGHQYVHEKYGQSALNNLTLYGQEQNPTTYSLGLMNVYLHDIKDAFVELGDTIRFPKHLENGKLKQFDFVVSNPPWNQDGYDEESLKKGDFIDRFNFGFVPKQSADWAWIQHMYASCNENGKVGLVIDNGCLFRSGKEGIIRQKFIEEDIIDCIILLPEKLFYNTGAPGAIIILNKTKSKERKNKILIINASKEFTKHRDVRKLNQLSDINIDLISKAYKDYTEKEGFARIIAIEEFKKNDFNLNVTLYVFPEEIQEQIDPKKEWRDLEQIDKEIEYTDKKIEKYLKEIYG